MKKLLTSVLTLALVLCCFTFVGCTKDEDNDPKPATIEQTLAICDQFIADMQAIQTKISAPDYEYPTTDAQASAKQVADTDKSSMGIEYSNYMDFDFNYDFKQVEYGPYDTETPADIYSLAGEMGEQIDMYLGIYKHNNLQLNTVYKFYMEEDGDTYTTYLKLINNKEQITITICTDDYCSQAILNLNSNLTWQSAEFKSYAGNSDYEYVSYIYIEKATNEDRLFNRVVELEIEGEGDGTREIFDGIDLDETTQKMLYIDELFTNSMNPVQAKAYSYLESLNLSSIVDNIDITNAIEIEVNLGE